MLAAVIVGGNAVAVTVIGGKAVMSCLCICLVVSHVIFFEMYTMAVRDVCTCQPIIVIVIIIVINHNITTAVSVIVAVIILILTTAVIMGVTLVWTVVARRGDAFLRRACGCLTSFDLLQSVLQRDLSEPQHDRARGCQREAYYA